MIFMDFVSLFWYHGMFTTYQLVPALKGFSSSPRHWVLGLEIYTDLTADMQPSIGPSMSRRKLGLEVSDLLICLVHRGSTHL